MNWDWISRNSDKIIDYLIAHIWLAAIPTVVGLVLAIPLGALARRYRWLYAPLIGTKILDPLNVVVALTIYTVALLVRVVADALASVPPEVRASATAMGYKH